MEQTAERVAIRGGAMPLQWPAGETASIIYRLPRDPRQRSSLFATAQTIVVNEGQMAVVLQDGVSHGGLVPGRYSFAKERVVAALDIVWVKTSQQAIKWGIGNVSTQDGIDISANGEMYVRVEDGVVFNKEIIQGAITLAERDLQRLLVPRVNRALTTQIAQSVAQELQMQQDVFEAAIKDKLGARLETMGLSIVSFEVANITFPAEFKAAWAGEKMAMLGAASTLVQAQTQAQVTQLEAGAAAQAKLLEGMADVQLLAAVQAQGIDPLQLKAMEAMKLLAENPSQGGGGLGDVARTNLLGQVAAAALVAPQMAQMAQMQQTQPVALLPAAPAVAPAAAPTTDDTAAKITEIEDKIDALGDQLAAGEIVESAYDKLVERLERRLERLTG
jgi:membrane protease subunit (stomatin/prohibitin family)